MLRGLRLSALQRNVTTMANAMAPKKPLVVVLGSTGTGKSDLAVELAKRFRGEIINADAMQLYKGLPIITNKIPDHERHGIPHHLLGLIDVDQAPWTVEDFKREAKTVIEEIRQRGNLPILVGGTQYYVNPILFADVTLDDVQGDSTQNFSILEESTETILAELKRVDPVMAERWHPNDRRKISRSLEIYLQTGRPASELYAEQQKRKELTASEGTTTHWENLLFWVYAEREPLKTRLDKRVDKMVTGGLLEEVREMQRIEEGLRSSGSEPDLTKGIWQSIGYPQFGTYLTACEQGKSTDELEQLKTAALEDMKAATRRYANYQTKWIRKKQIPLLQEQGPAAMGSLYLLDSTDVTQFQENVVHPAADVTLQFLKGEARPAPGDMSDLAREVLTLASETTEKPEFVQKTCELCGTVAVTDKAWQQHVRGTAHRRLMKKRKRLALVPVDDAAASAATAGEAETEVQAELGESLPLEGQVAS